MAELATAAPYGDPREVDTASMKRNYILRASVSPDELFTFRKGALVGIRPGDVRMIEPVLDGEPRADLEIVGVYDDERGQIDPIIDDGADGEALDAYGKSIRVSVRDGDLGNFDTAAPGVNQILPAHVGQPCFAKNDNTLWLTDDGGTLSFAGLVGAVNARGKVTLRNTWDTRQNWKNFGTAFTITAADVPIVDAGGYTTETDVEGALQEIYPLVLAGMTVSKKTLTANATTITAAAATEAVNIGTALPPNARIVGVDFHTYTEFSGGAVGDFTVDIGTSGDVDALVDGADLFAAAVDGGPATIPQGIRPNKFFAAGGQLIATFRCGSDDVGDATAGAITIDVLYVVLA